MSRGSSNFESHSHDITQDDRFLAIFLIYSQMLPPKLLPSKTLQIILPYSSFNSNLHPNPSTIPLLQRVLTPYIKLSRNLGRVPVTDGYGRCHYRVVITSLCQRSCPLIFLQKLSSFPSYYDVGSNFRRSLYRAIFFRYKCQSHWLLLEHASVVKFSHICVREDSKQRLSSNKKLHEDVVLSTLQNTLMTNLVQGGLDVALI